MTALDIARLKAAAQAATPGEWKWDGRKQDEDGYVYIPECSYLVGGISLAFQHEDYQADCDFIAAANPAAVLELIERHDDRVREVLEISGRIKDIEQTAARQLAERDQEIERLRAQIDKVSQQLSEASWALNPDRMGQ